MWLHVYAVHLRTGRFGENTWQGHNDIGCFFEMLEYWEVRRPKLGVMENTKDLATEDKTKETAMVHLDNSLNRMSNNTMDTSPSSWNTTFGQTTAATGTPTILGWV